MDFNQIYFQSVFCENKFSLNHFKVGFERFIYTHTHTKSHIVSNCQNNFLPENELSLQSFHTILCELPFRYKI